MSEGRRITLDPIAEPIIVETEVREVESTIPAGFRIEWISGSHEGVDFDLSAGAGVGSKYLTIRVGDRYWVVDMELWFTEFLNRVFD